MLRYEKLSGHICKGSQPTLARNPCVKTVPYAVELNGYLTARNNIQVTATLRIG
jgi:hypothetical protein